MINIQINETPESNSIDASTTLNDYIDNLFVDRYGNDYVLTKIIVNGKELGNLYQAEELSSAIGEFEDLKLTIATKNEIAFQSLQTCSHLIENLIKCLKETSQMYSQNDFGKASEKLVEATDLIDLFVQFGFNIRSIIKNEQNENDPVFKTIHELEIHLLGVLKALIPSKEKKDIIMLCDLIEYELVDNLTKWKIQIIPELKKLIEA